jgi:uncharacterized membrane protein
MHRGEIEMDFSIRTRNIGPIVFIAVGLGIVGASLNYEIGSLSSMGPGYFPIILGIILAGFGALDIVRQRKALGDEATIEINVVSAAYIIASVLAFAFLLESFGLYSAVIACVVVSTRASRRVSLLRSLVIGLVAAITCHIVFVKGLNLLVPLWPEFVGF